MKLKIEISNSAEEEIVIRCNEQNERINRIARVIQNLINEDAEMVLTLGETQYFVPYKKILFFEMQNGKITAHTKDKMFYSEGTLTNLEKNLPTYFVRGGKSCIINAQQVSGLAHNLTGPSKVYFNNCDKIAFTSRAYYNFLIDKIYIIRGLN